MLSFGVIALLPSLALATATDESADVELFHDRQSLPAPLVMLPQDAGDESPACLDGSPYGVYFRPSTRNSTRWTIYIKGGGWCYDETDCLARSRQRLGSSRHWPSEEACSCINPLEDGSFDGDCNCMYLPYADGASFSGFRPKPWPVTDVDGEQKGQLFFRGIKNLDAALDFAFAHGLAQATEFILTGGSAGGLSTFLHADRVTTRLKERGATAKVRAAPVVGFFLDHADLKHDSHNYTERMRYIYRMQNLTFGPDGGLSPECRAAFPDHPHYCFMSPHMQKFIETPYFMFNSKYDLWQLMNELQLKKGRYPYREVFQYGEDFLAQFAKVREDPKHGAVITSCVCHGCPWDQISLKGTSAYQHFADWYYGKTSGQAAIHVDGRGPNGDGKLRFQPKCAHVSPRSARTILEAAALPEQVFFV